MLPGEPGDDRRVKVLTLTKAGAALRTKLSRLSPQSPVMVQLCAADRVTLERLLTTLLADANQGRNR